jgi:hypothetical protein
MGACADPRCPPGYLQEGDTCRRCKVVEGSKGGVCIVGDAAAISAGDHDAANDPDESTREAATHTALDGGDLDGEQASDGGASMQVDGASPQDSPSNAEAGHGSDATTATGCASNPCQHGGMCNGSGSQYSCDCASTGYEGAHCETDIDECSGPNVCAGASAEGVAFSYRCLNESPHYRCEGQFPDWPIQDPPSRFTTGVRVVDDAKTGLQWEQPMGATAYTWADAKARCEAKGAGWRIPSKAELESIIDDTRAEPAIDITAFPDTPAVLQWTSTLFAGIPAAGGPASQSIWAVNFRDGTVYPMVFGGFVVRCVRQRQ